MGRKKPSVQNKKKLTGRDMKELKKKTKDMTFGMKNKNKSKKAQKMMKSMAAKKGGLDTFINDQYKKKLQKKKDEQERKFYASLYGKGEAATETKAVKKIMSQNPTLKICPFFKAGMCNKGRKCKFSHERNVDSKTSKINLYQDKREEKKKEDKGMKNWDQTTLENAIKKNQDKYDGNKKTEKVCNFFLDAIEKRIYGWFWVCPNGYICQYVHALPQGYILKTDVGDEEEEEDTELLEEKLDKQILELAASGKKLTPVSLELFLEWKKKRLEKQEKEREEKRMKELQKFGHKKNLNKMISGRSLFMFKMVEQEEEEGGDDIVDIIQEEKEEFKNIKVHKLEDYIVKGQDEKETTTTKGKDSAPKVSEKTEPPIEENIDIDEDAFADEDIGDLDDDDEDFED